jgi:hypothetical protein
VTLLNDATAAKTSWIRMFDALKNGKKQARVLNAEAGFNMFVQVSK